MKCGKQPSDVAPRQESLAVRASLPPALSLLFVGEGVRLGQGAVVLQQ